MFVHHPDAIRCDLCGVELRGTVNDADKAGWEWFTQYRRHTFHACRACFTTRRSEYGEELRKAMVKP